MKALRNLLAVASLALLAACSSSSEPTRIEIVDVSGPLDARALNFMADSIERAADNGRELVLLQIDSKAVLDGQAYDRLLALMENPPIPVATWVGPAPAFAYGGAVVLAEAASQRAAAEGSWWGKFVPVVLGESRDPGDRIPPFPSDPMPVEEWAGTILEPAHYQLLVQLDGLEFHTSNGPVIVHTLNDPDDQLSVKRTTFIKPGLVDRFFRLAVIPEAAFFFLVVGLTIVVFEFYALGPGVAAAVGAISLLLGGWGLATLPTRWWALVLILFGWVCLTWAHQSGRRVPGTTLGTILMFLGGLWMIDGGGQIDPRWWLVMLSVLAVLFFYLLAMPTVQRARLSTTTIGREALVGATGTALVDFDPDGLVEVGGARWRASGHREAGLTEGSEIVVTGVDGLYLEVDRRQPDRET